MIISLSFINGFQKIVAEKVFNFWGHIRVQHYEPIKTSNAEESPVKSNAEIEKRIQKTENVKSVASFATRSAILNANGTIEGILLKGVDEQYPFEKINQFLIKGEWPELSIGHDKFEIALSKYIADQLDVDIGQSVLIYFIQDNDTEPRTRKIKISGIFNTGIDVYDKVYAIGQLSLIQKMNNWEKNQIGGYEITLTDPEKMELTGDLLFNELPPGMNAITLKELSPEIFDWLNLQDINKYILIIVMSIVALINLITCLIILLLERTKMIAILKSLGSSDGVIQKTFILYGTWISGLGIAVGTVIGIGICILEKNYKFIKLNEEAYYVSSAPVYIEPGQIVLIIVGTFLISMLILTIPTYIIKKVSPVKTLQFK